MALASPPPPNLPLLTQCRLFGGATLLLPASNLAKGRSADNGSPACRKMGSPTHRGGRTKPYVHCFQQSTAAQSRLNALCPQPVTPLLSACRVAASRCLLYQTVSYVDKSQAVVPTCTRAVVLHARDRLFYCLLLVKKELAGSTFSRLPFGNTGVIQRLVIGSLGP